MSGTLGRYCVKAVLLGACGVLNLPTAALAHHSYVMFDRSQIKTIDGTIAKVEWNNPHVYIWAWAPSSAQKGQFDLYGFEAGGPAGLARYGWRKDLLKPGDKVLIEYFPLKDGRHGGYFVAAKRPSGERISGDEASRLRLPGEKNSPATPAF